MTQPRPTHGAWRWFAAWMTVGAIASFTVLGAFSVLGLIALPIAALVAWPTVRRSRGAGASGILTGLGIPCLYVAYLNRQGPGNVCTYYADGGQSCVQEYNPLLWAGAALVLIATGLFIFTFQRRRKHTIPSGSRSTGPLAR